MIEDQVEVITKAEHEAAIAKLHSEFGCELCDPNGTIWEQAAKLQRENEELRARIKELENKPIPMNDEIRFILGRPNFTLIGLANKLREIGYEIKHSSEDEQATVIHWMLNLYLKHGSDWTIKGDEELQGKGGTNGD